MRAPGRPLELFAASSNQGKLREYCRMAEAASAPVQLKLVPRFDSLPPFDEIWPTFTENAAGKALHYSRLAPGILIADDSGLVVPALGGAPGVQSARYAGPGASDADRVQKLVSEMRGKQGADRQARFVCVIAAAEAGKVRGLFSASAEGIVLEEPRGQSGFGYDPIFLFPPVGKTFAELSREEKNLHSHRGKAFRKAMEFLLETHLP